MMAARPGKITAKGVRGGARLEFRYEAGPELRRFIMQGQNLFTRMQGPVNEAHQDIGYTVVKHAHQVLRERMRSHQPQRPGRETGKLRAALDRDVDINPPWRLIPASHRRAGIVIDWDKELNRRVTDEKGNSYWRAVEYGFTRRARGHLFRTRGGALVGPMGGVSNRALGMIGGGDPRMPRVGVGTEFTYSFGGYHFVRDGMKRARTELTARLSSRAVNNPYRLAFHTMPDEMMRVMQFYVGGGRGTRPRGEGGGFIPGHRSHY